MKALVVWSPAGNPDSVVKAYSRFVSNVADNAVSSMRLTNNIIFSNMDSWKSVLEQAKDNSRHLSNLNVNAAKTFEQNSREIIATAKDANTNTNTNTETTTSNTTQQQNKKI